MHVIQTHTIKNKNKKKQIIWTSSFTGGSINYPQHKSIPGCFSHSGGCNACRLPEWHLPLTPPQESF